MMLEFQHDSYLFHRYKILIASSGIFNWPKSQLFENDLGIRILW